MKSDHAIPESSLLCEVPFPEECSFLKHLFEHGQDAIYIFELKGLKIVNCNPAFEKIIGYTQEEARLLTVSELSPNAEEIESLIQTRLIPGGRIHIKHWDIRSKDGELLPGEIIAELFEHQQVCFGWVTFRDMSEIRKRERKLEQADGLLHGLIDDSKEMIATVDTDLRFVCVNEAFREVFERIFGIKVKAGFRLSELLTRLPRKSARMQASWAKALAGEKFTVIEEWGNTRKNGGFYEVSFSPIHDRSGRQTGAAQIVRDVTERVKSQRDLTQMRERLELAISGSNDGIWDWPNVNKAEQWWSPRVYELIGYDPNEIKARHESLFRLVHWEDVAKTRRAFRDHLKSGEDFRHECRIKVKSGEYRWFLIRGRISRNGLRRSFRMTGCLSDIHRRKQAEQNLLNSEDLLRRTQQMAWVGGWELDVESNEIQWTDEVYRIHDLPYTFQPTLQEMVSFYEPESGMLFKKAFSRTMDGAGPYDLVLKLRTARGKRITVRTMGEAEFRNGRPVVIRGMLQDITETKNIENALRESEQRLALTLREADIGLWDWNLKTDEVSFDACLLEMLGYSEREIQEVMEAWYRITHPEDLIRMKEAIQAHYRKESDFYEVECRLKAKNGEWKTFLDRGAVVEWDRFGRPLRMLGTRMDITGRKLQEQERMKVSKLESLELLAGGIAHDFNNIMMAVSLNLDMILQKVDSRNDIYQELREALEAANRARALARRLSTFSRETELVKKPLHVDKMISSTVNFALRGSSVRPHMEIPDYLPAVLADEGQICQVFENLAINAREACSEGGTLWVSARLRNIKKNQLPELKAGCYVQIDFRDEGQGIPEEVLHRVFDPYFSTKNRGSGLGLTTVYSILKKHDGGIRVSSAPGEGTTFSLFLPALREAKSTEKQEPNEISKGSGKVLVIDDDRTVRKSLDHALVALGYESYVVSNAKGGCEVYRRQLEKSEPFKAVILDATLRGEAGGAQAVRDLLEIDASARVILCSGYSEDSRLANWKDLGFVQRISKPCLLEELALALKDARMQLP